jgi:hypothetical protein
MIRWCTALVALGVGAVVFVVSLPLVWNRSVVAGGGGDPLVTSYTGVREYLEPPVTVAHRLPEPLPLGLRVVVCVVLPIGLGVVLLAVGGAGQAAARTAAVGLAAAQLGTVVPYLIRLYGPATETTSGGDAYRITDQPGAGTWLALVGLALLLVAALMAPAGGLRAVRHGGLPGEPGRRTVRQRRLVLVGMTGCVALAVALGVPWFGSVSSASDSRFVPVASWSGVFAVSPWLSLAAHLVPAAGWVSSVVFVLLLLAAASGVPAAVTARSAVAVPVLRILCGVAALVALALLGVAYLVGHRGGVLGTVHLLELLAANPRHQQVAALAPGPYLALAGLLLILVFAVGPTPGLLLRSAAGRVARDGGCQ